MQKQVYAPTGRAFGGHVNSERISSFCWLLDIALGVLSVEQVLELTHLLGEREQEVLMREIDAYTPL